MRDALYNVCVYLVMVQFSINYFEIRGLANSMTMVVSAITVLSFCSLPGT